MVWINPLIAVSQTARGLLVNACVRERERERERENFFFFLNFETSLFIQTRFHYNIKFELKAITKKL